MSALISWALTKGLPYILVGLLAATGAAVTTHKLDLGTINGLKLAQANAVIAAENKARAQQQAYDAIAVTQAKQEATDQAARADQAASQLHEVEFHVSTKVVASNCVPFGLVRVLDAAASGRIVNALSLPAGKSDDACAPLTWDALARSVVGNYYTARANEGQLNHLVDTLRQMAAAKK